MTEVLILKLHKDTILHYFDVYYIICVGVECGKHKDVKLTFLDEDRVAFFSQPTHDLWMNVFQISKKSHHVALKFKNANIVQMVNITECHSLATL